MSFLAPTAFIFAATLPVVIVFYLLKRKRVVKLVSSTVLWQRFLAETQANSPFQKLKHNWLLLLQLLLLTLAVLALARPIREGDQRDRKLRVIILDGSASMQATDESPSRFHRARADALRLVDGMKDDEEAMVVLAAGSTAVKQSPTTDKTALRKAIQSAQPVDAPTRLSEAFQLAESLVKTQAAVASAEEGERVPDAEIHLFSDGAFREVQGFKNKNLPLIYHRIGVRGNNVGIVSLDVRANPDNAAERALFAGIANPSPVEQQVEVELRFEDQVLELKPVTIPATNTVPLVFIARQPHDGVFSLRLTTPDDLSADNEASIVSLLPRPVRVLLVTGGNRFLEKGLRGAGTVTLALATVPPEAVTDFDIVVLDGIAPLAWPKVAVMAIHVGHTNLFSSWSEISQPAIVDWRTTDPLLRFVNFDNVYVQSTLKVPPVPWGVSLAEARETALVVAGEVDHQRTIWIGFDPLQSNWPLRISFPIFLANAIEWLSPSGGSKDRMVRAGEPIRLRVPSPAPKAEVTRPDGESVEWPLREGALEVLFGDTGQRGVYRMRHGTNDWLFTVLLDAAESDITPRAEVSLGSYGKAAASAVKRANIELWRWVAALALAFLMFEWWYYHRRTA